MAGKPNYFVITSGPGGKHTEYFSRHPLDAALYILRADQQGRDYHVFAVDEDRAREASLAELAAAEPSPGLVAEMWRNARASWLLHHLHIPEDSGAPWGPDWTGAGERWAAAFRTPLPDGIEDHPAFAGLIRRGWDRLRARVDVLLPLLEHEDQWRDRARDSYPEWSSREYQQAWRQLDGMAGTQLKGAADFFLRMALARDPRAGRIEGFLGIGHPGLELWARVAYRLTPEDPEAADQYDAYQSTGEDIEEADRLFARFTPGGAPLSDQERVWAARWPREQDPALPRDYTPDGEDAQREYWQRSRAQWTAFEERETAQYAAFAFLAEHHEEIAARAPAGASEGVVAQARRLVRAAFPSEQQARENVARQLGALDVLLDVPDAPDLSYALGQHGQVWMALGRVEEALRALTWNLTEPSQEPDDVPMLAPPLLRIGPEGGPYTVTSDPRRALSAWTEQHRPGPDTLFPANPARIEESEADGRWRERTPRSLVEQARAAVSGHREHWQIDRELAQWLLAGEPEGLRPEEMGTRWIRYMGDVPPRGPVLAWAARLTSFDVEASNMLARIQQGAAQEQATIDWELDFTLQWGPVYRPAKELEEAAELAAMDDSALEELYPGQSGDELGARPAPAPRATILASATVGDTQYAHAEFTRPPRRAVVVYSEGGFPSPYRLTDSRLTDTDVLFERLTSAQGRALAAAEGTGAAQRAAREAAEKAWDAARRAEYSSDLRTELYVLAEQVQSGKLDAARYAQRAAPMWEELFPLLEGRGPLESGDLRRWYSVRVAGDDTAWGTLTADPLEAVVRWAQRDRPVQQHVILTGTAGSAESTELPVGRVVAQAVREAEGGQEPRLAQALADWLDQSRLSVAVHTRDGRDPAAWRQAGWAWRVRIGESLPPEVTSRLEPAAAREVARGDLEMLSAVRAAGEELTGTSESLQALHEQFRVLAAASVEIEQARPYVRAALDQLISVDQVAPGDGQELRQDAARLWFLSQELGRSNLMEVFKQVADPTHVPQTNASTLGALPQRLQDAPEAARRLLATAERAVGHQVLESLYAGYPDIVLEEKTSAAHDASAAVLLQAAAEATRGQAISRAQAWSTPRQAARAALPPARPQQGLDAAQRAALPPASPQAPTVR